jgi:predicted O-linked N-acetylglucosamine transferase (SPINDLY family)
MGYTFSKRLEIFNSRVAPVQISWLATCNTVGFNTIDYLIADNNLITSDEEHLYPEKILKLPDIWNVHCGNGIERNFTKSPCETNDYFTFGSLNNFHKISDEVVEAWSRILKKCDKSKLILKSSSFETNNEKIFEKFKKHDLESKIEILDIRDFINKNDHLNVYKRIDLGLDTFPYNGVTTTFESLWMGVPVLVLKGFNFNSRCGFSIINNSNFKNLITNNIDEYVDRAIYFYDNREEFIKLKSELFKNILSTPLFNTQRFSKNFAQALLGLIE